MNKICEDVCFVFWLMGFSTGSDYLITVSNCQHSFHISLCALCVDVFMTLMTLLFVKVDPYFDICQMCPFT